jgi:transcriptional regulator with XRE-family HTH domain
MKSGHPGIKAPQPVDIQVGSRVRYRRMVLGLSQETLGEALGVTFQQVQKYEKGANRIGAGRLQTIADFLEVPVGFFFDGATRRRADHRDVVLDLVNTSEGLRLNRAFAAVKDPRTRARIISLVEAVSGSAD